MHSIVFCGHDVGWEKTLPDGFHIKGLLAAYALPEQRPTIGFVLVRKIGSGGIVCICRTSDDESDRDEGLGICRRVRRK